MPNRVAVHIFTMSFRGLIYKNVIWGHSRALGFAGPITFPAFVVDLSWHQCAVRQMVGLLAFHVLEFMNAAIYSYNTFREEPPPPPNATLMVEAVDAVVVC